MGNFSRLLVLLVLAGCAPTPTPVPSSVAPVPQVYTCQQEKEMRVELAVLAKTFGKNDSTVIKAMDDYRLERKALARLHGQDTPQCSPDVGS